MYMDHLNNNTPPSLGGAGGFHHYVDAAGGVLPVSAFSAFHLLRNYNYLIGPSHSDLTKSTTLSELSSRLQPDHTLHSPGKPLQPQVPPPPPPTVPDCSKRIASLAPLPPLPTLTLDGLGNHPPNLLSARGIFTNLQYNSAHHAHSSGLLSPEGYLSFKRHRGEKKPIPEEQKDEKYFERRKRNNQAAKKSRDARKIREDQVALKATILEHENAILKAQVLTLREEASALRQMLLQKKSLDLNT